MSDIDFLATIDDYTHKEWLYLRNHQTSSSGVLFGQGSNSFMSSEGQSYGMIMAYLEGDQPLFGLYYSVFKARNQRTSGQNYNNGSPATAGFAYDNLFAWESFTAPSATRIANITLTTTKQVVLTDTTAGGFTVTLPPISGASTDDGYVGVYDKLGTWGTGGKNLTIATADGSTIGGSPSPLVISTANAQSLFKSDGANNWVRTVKNPYGPISLNGATATDGDLMVAFALTMAGKDWANASYAADGLAISRDILTNVVRTAGPYSSLPGFANANQTDQPGYFFYASDYCAPYAYQIFAEADPTNAVAWTKLRDDTFTLWNNLRDPALNGGSVIGVPPPFIGQYWADGTFYQYKGPTDPKAGFMQESPRLFWHAAFSWIFGDKRGAEIINAMPFLYNRYLSDGSLTTDYQKDGTGNTTSNPKNMTYATMLTYLAINKPSRIKQYFDATLAPLWVSADGGATGYFGPTAADYYFQFGTYIQLKCIRMILQYHGRIPIAPIVTRFLGPDEV